MSAGGEGGGGDGSGEHGDGGGGDGDGGGGDGDCGGGDGGGSEGDGGEGEGGGSGGGAGGSSGQARLGAHASVAKLHAQGTAMKYRLWQACRLVPLSAHVLSAPLTSAQRYPRQHMRGGLGGERGGGTGSELGGGGLGGGGLGGVQRVPACPQTSQLGQQRKPFL